MATRYLNAGATGANNGTSEANGWTSPASVNAGLSAGDTLIISPGTYSPAVSFTIGSKANLTILIKPGATTPAIFGGQTYVSGPQPVGSGFYDTDGMVMDGRQRTAGGDLVYDSNGDAIPLIKFVGQSVEHTVQTAAVPTCVYWRQSVNVIVRGVECDRSAFWLTEGKVSMGMSFSDLSDNITIEDCYIHHVPSDLLSINTSYTLTAGQYEHIVIRRSRFEQSGDDGMQIGGPGGITIEDCWISNTGCPIQHKFGHSDGIQLPRYGKQFRIRRNFFRDFGQNCFVENTSGDVWFYNNISFATTIGAKAFSMDGGGSLPLVVANNTFHGIVDFTAVSGPLVNGTGARVISNNILTNCKTGFFAADQGLIDSSNIWYDFPGVQWYDSNGLPAATPSPRYFGSARSMDPGLVNPNNQDFRIASGSSNATTGAVDLSAYFTDDYNGNTRSSWTVGADQTIATTSAPAFTLQPIAQTLDEGAPLTLTVLASGSPSPTYQWRKDGSNISGATSATYFLAITTLADDGTYDCVATNSEDSATSTAVVVDIVDVPDPEVPTFTLQPVSQTVTVGDDVNFSAAVEGIPDATYQWFRNGVAMEGRNTLFLSLLDVTLDDAASYSVTATSPITSVESSAATLTVVEYVTAPVPLGYRSSTMVAFGAF
jgi:hypothetical protein